MSDEGPEGNGFWIGLIVGGLLGAGASYLLGMENKEEAKKKLLEKGKWLLENFGEIGEEIKEKSLEVKDEAAERVSEVRDEIEEKVKDLPEIAEEAVENVQKAAQEAVTSIVNAVEAKEIESLSVKSEKEKTINPGKRFFFKKKKLD
jgi:gas vesicle protein